MAIDLSSLNPKQREAVLHEGRPLALIAGAGCITGDTIINFNRASKGFKCTILHAYKQFNGPQRHKGWDKTIPTFVRSFDGDFIKLNRVIGIVYSGKKKVYKLTLENGLAIKATKDHEIMTDSGFIELGKLSSNNLVMCDTLYAEASATKNPKRRDKMVRSLLYYPYGSKDKGTRRRVEEYRLSYDARLNGLSLEEMITILRTDAKESSKLKFSSPELDIHHKDFDHTNNHPDNLLLCTVEEHRAFHSEYSYSMFNQGKPKFSKVKSVEYYSEEDTYDIQCEAPNHNFVANGMVIHNSGKTHCVMTKIAKLIDDGVPPQHIMATAFTNKSADEMIERVAKKIGEEKALKLRMGTFHSICYRIFNDINKKIRPGYKAPELIRNGEKYLFMYRYTKDNDLAFKGIKEIYSQIGRWKNAGITWQEVMKEVEKEFPTATPQVLRSVAIAHCYKAYEDYLAKQRKMDFDDMLLRTLLLLRSPQAADELKRIRKHTKYIIVDEFQDTNGVQYDIIDTIVGGPDNCNIYIMLVGDDFQLIYSFRGSNIDSIHRFLNRYSFDVIKLEQNYRSTKKIVDAGNRLIAHNSNQIPKILFTENMEGENIKTMINHNENLEAGEIVEKINELILEGFSYSDIAIIYRINAQSRAIVDDLVLNHIPHKVYSKYSFYERSEIKDIIAYMKILYNPYEADMDDFVRICNKPTRYLSKDLMEKVHDLQIEEDYETFWEALCNSHKLGVKHFQQQALDKFVGDIENWKTIANLNNASTAMLVRMTMQDVGYEKWLKDNQDGSKLDEVDDADEDQLMNLDALYEGTSRFENPEDYFVYVEGLKKMQNKEKDYVHCMTIHKAKGLEFQVVFLIGFCDRLYPFYKSQEEIGGDESERRVAYVGATRAKELLYVSAIRGTFGRFKVNESPYIRQMGLQLPQAHFVP